MEPYYYIYRVNGGHPMRRHETGKEAQAEAERLAAKHPGCQFEILKCIGVSLAELPKAKTEWARTENTDQQPHSFYQYQGKSIGL